jgi:prophage regulatory protein
MRILRLKAVMELTGLGCSTIYKYVKEGIFPARVALGPRAIGFVENEVQDWILARINTRDGIPESGR